MTDTVKPGEQASAPGTTATLPTAPGAAGQVVDLAAARSAGAAEAAKAATEIVEACNQAQRMGLDGASAMATEFIAKATPVAEVRKALMDKLAAQSDATAVTGQHGGKPGGTGAKKLAAIIDHRAIYDRMNNIGRK